MPNAFPPCQADAPASGQCVCLLARSGNPLHAPAVFRACNKHRPPPCEAVLSHVLFITHSIKHNFLLRFPNFGSTTVFFRYDVDT